MTVTDLTRSIIVHGNGLRCSVLLGKGLAREAGKPYQQVVLKLLQQLKSSMGAYPFLQSLSAILSQGTPNAENLPAELLGKTPPELRSRVEQTIYRLLRQYYVELPVPLFYQDLASLLKARVFSRVLTTNYDNLLEQALGSPPNPWWPDRDYFVINVPALDRTDLKRRLESSREDSLLILKLQGDLMQEGGDFDLAAIENALREHRKTLYAQLSENLLVVGYEHESVGVDKALHAQSGGAIWWVNGGNVDPGLQELGGARPINLITGPGSTPQEVFGAMLTIIARMPGTTYGSETLAITDSPPGPDFPPDDLGATFLFDKLARAQDELERLRQSAPRRTNPEVEAQIDYQKRQISEIEDQVRLGQKDQILNVLSRLSFAQADPELQQFVDTNKRIIETEFQKPTPNQHLLSAALSAIAVSAQRLGEIAAPADTTQELDTFLPSSLGSGV